MPVEREMRPKDKYTIFDRKVKGYRKGIHSECLPLVFGLGLDRVWVGGGWEREGWEGASGVGLVSRDEG